MTPFSEAAARVVAGAEPADEAAALVAAMTVEERLGCLDGDLPFWDGLAAMVGRGYGSQAWPAAAVARLGVPGLAFADGPRGSVMGPSTTFPVSMARGASFDPGLEQRVGEAIGAEIRAHGATHTGAVCMNLLRHPAWGRAQETYGEDPHHVGEMAVAFMRGLQQHVMASMKHFACNSMENARFTVDVTVGERALHEVYLPHFKRVADAGVASVMSAYNALNGEWCGDSAALLSTVLRDEWGWDGFVITDFMLGLHDPVGSVAAGCNIEMPFAHQRAQVLADAVESGDLEIAVVDRRVTEVVTTFLRFAWVYDAQPDPSVIGSADHRRLAREAASSSMVLLTNDGLLPVAAESLSTVAVLGRRAAVATLGDAGSSNVVDTPDPVTPLDGITAALPGATVRHHAEDVSVAAEADLVVVVVGFTGADEGEYIGGGMSAVLAPILPPPDHPTVGSSDRELTEAIGAVITGGDQGGAVGGDRDSLRLSDADEALIEAACGVNDRVVVAVVAGSAVVAPWLAAPGATLMLWYAGSEGGTALADVLFGEAEPGGRLPFAVPVDEADLVEFDKEAHACTYGLLHGQWWLDANGVTPHLPFGHGLTYTTFSLGPARGGSDTVTAEVTNTGARSGSTVVQVYATVPTSELERPRRRLVGFAKVTLEPGSTVAVEVEIDLALLDVRVDGTWVTEDAPVELYVGLDAASTVRVGRTTA